MKTQNMNSSIDQIINFNMKPKDIYKYLNRFIIKQTEAKKVLSVAICDHYNYIKSFLGNFKSTKKKLSKNKNYCKPNVLIMGPTGVGKTYLMKTLAQLVGVPFVKADATKFSETGYMGNDVEDLVRDLVKSSSGDVNLAQYGIIYIDEIDKIATNNVSSGRDVSGRGVQINLLKIMEESEVNLFSPADIFSQMKQIFSNYTFSNKINLKNQKTTINTKHILFIVSGVFDNLEGIISERINSNTSIGFSSSSKNFKNIKREKVLKYSNSTDFIKYGFEPEFIGRLPVRVSCKNLNEKDLRNILTSSEENILDQYITDFKGYGINVKFTYNAIKNVAKEAILEKTGARGLLTILEKKLRDCKFELPSLEIKKIKINSDFIKNPKEKINYLIEQNRIRKDKKLFKKIRNEMNLFCERFKKENGVHLEFSKESLKEIFKLKKQNNDSETIQSIFNKIFGNISHGLKIIKQKKGKKKFLITRKMISNPEKEISNLIQNAFKK
jgi:ATP-dependent Clp protease ATP-binding subunit ClpX